MAEGQTEGGILQGIGQALIEEMKFDDKGKCLTTDFLDYKIYSAMDTPRIDSVLLDHPDPYGPFGAKSVSEMPTNGPAPVIGNAIFNAIGVRLRDLPYSPEKVLKALGKL